MRILTKKCNKCRNIVDLEFGDDDYNEYEEVLENREYVCKECFVPNTTFRTNLSGFKAKKVVFPKPENYKDFLKKEKKKDWDEIKKKHEREIVGSSFIF